MNQLRSPPIRLEQPAEIVVAVDHAKPLNSPPRSLGRFIIDGHRNTVADALMRTVLVEELSVPSDDALQAVQYEEVVEAFVADAAHPSFGMGILPETFEICGPKA